MKTNSTSNSGRATLGALLFMLGIGLLCSIPFTRTQAQLPVCDGNAGSGSVGPAPGGPSAGWAEKCPITPNGPNVNMESSCVEGLTCEHYLLTVSGTTAAWSGQKVHVTVNWNDPADEFDLYIHKCADAQCT